VAVGGRAEFVARNMSLDGTLVDPARKVDRIPGVTQYHVGAGARWGRLWASYRAFTRSREYRTGPAHHAYSSMSAGIDVLP
jgi:hypothetical protein